MSGFEHTYPRDVEADAGPDEDSATRTQSLASASRSVVFHEQHANPPPPPPFTARFWDSDPAIAKSRKTFFRILLAGTLLTIFVIFGVLGIFWGSLWKLEDYVHNLDGWVVDFDGGVVGQTVIEVFQNNTGQLQQMTWRVVDASQFVNGAEDVANAVVQEKTWAAVTINPGASTNLSAALASADGSYNGSLAVTAYAAEARNENGYAEFLYPTMLVPLEAAATAFSSLNAQRIASNSSLDLQTLLAQAPSVVTRPVYYTVNNIRPFDALVATAVDFVGLIYLLIISFIICMMNYQARVIASGLNRHLRLRSLLLLRMIAPIVLYFFISLFFSLLSETFKAPFTRVFGGWGFVIYWMMNWAGMCAMGLAMEAVITILTPAFTPFFLVLWIISNVSVASFPIELLPGVFKYGYATPFYNVSRTVRTILFNTRNQIGLNFGVQLAWIGISLITIPLFTTILRRREMRAWRLQQQLQARINEKP
ncbi:hypothetical protein M0805_001690 [Coniferiporia weirii]|nr:hypothetical protein M0805_001690 [Coniferiporia weirii]